MNERIEDSGHDEPPPAETLAVIARHVVELVRGGEESVLRVLSPDGRAGLSITITAQGISLSVAGADVVLQTAGKLSIDAEELSLHGRSGLTVTTGGDARVEVAGDMSSEARIQNVRARLGNVNIRANDDVCLDGERVRLNSPPLRPLTPKRAVAGSPQPSPDEGED